MSKLAHSNDETMVQIETARLKEEGVVSDDLRERLEAVIEHLKFNGHTEQSQQVLALREVLAEPEQLMVAVAWMYYDINLEQSTGFSLDPPRTELALSTWRTLYAPPAKEVKPYDPDEVGDIIYGDMEVKP